MKRPNIVLILADDMGFGDFSIFNGNATKTANINRILEEGVCLRQHYSASPVCAPARAALMTGRYPHRTGVIDTLQHRGLDHLSLKETTVADLFKSAGYKTGLMGKWHLGSILPEYHPNARGFDEFTGFRGGWNYYYNWKLEHNGHSVKYDGRYLTDLLTDESVKFINENKDQPFFLHVAYTAPHWPLQAPEEELEPYIKDGRFNKGVSYIYAMINRMDKGIGRILQAIQKNGLDDNTMVIFTSDNGPEISGEFVGDDDMSTNRFNFDLRGSKYYVYDGGIRVPAVVRWPNKIESGRVTDDFFHFTDWLPTFAEAAGIEIPERLKLDGKSRFGALTGGSDVNDESHFWQWNRYTPSITCNAAMRYGPWKLVRPAIEPLMKVSEKDKELDNLITNCPECFSELVVEPEPQRENPDPFPYQLFNVVDDPSETRDLSAEYPEKVAEMAEKLEEWFAEVDSERKKLY